MYHLIESVDCDGCLIHRVDITTKPLHSTNPAHTLPAPCQCTEYVETLTLDGAKFRVADILGKNFRSLDKDQYYFTQTVAAYEMVDVGLLDQITSLNHVNRMLSVDDRMTPFVSLGDIDMLAREYDLKMHRKTNYRLHPSMVYMIVDYRENMRKQFSTDLSDKGARFIAYSTGNTIEMVNDTPIDVIDTDSFFNDGSVSVCIKMHKINFKIRLLPDHFVGCNVHS